MIEINLLQNRNCNAKLVDKEKYMRNLKTNDRNELIYKIEANS